MRENGINSVFPLFSEGDSLSVEIGCGKGDFIVGLSEKNPDGYFIAVERIADVAMFALEKYSRALADGHPDNVRFIIGNASYIEDWFPNGSISDIYLNFSDPWPKSGHYKRRLTYRDYLLIYSRIQGEGGCLHVKTDNVGLFDFTLEELEASPYGLVWQTRNLHESEYASDNVMTEYERKFSEAGTPINALLSVKR